MDPMSDIIVMQTDGMDQGKFRLPQDPKLRATASLASMVRPKLKVHGLWIFGALTARVMMMMMMLTMMIMIIVRVRL